MAIISRMLSVMVWVMSLFMLQASAASAHETQSKADEGISLIIHNSQITTLDPDHPLATAVAVRHGRFVKVGTDREILAMRGETTQVINAQGRRMIPGLNDSHSHYIRGGLAFNAVLRWDGVPTLADGLEMIRLQALRTPKGQWVRVIGGWTPHQFQEKRLPTPEELTKVAPHTPVYVQYFYSRAVLNQAGLEAIGFTEHTKLPPGSRLELGPDGNPTGLLIADPHPALLYRSIASLPALSPEEQVNSTIHLFYELARFGLTSVIDVGGGGQHYPANYKTAEQLAEKARFPLRVSYFLFGADSGERICRFPKVGHTGSTEYEYRSLARGRVRHRRRRRVLGVGCGGF